MKDFAELLMSQFTGGMLKPGYSNAVMADISAFYREFSEVLGISKAKPLTSDSIKTVLQYVIYNAVLTNSIPSAVHQKALDEMQPLIVQDHLCTLCAKLQEHLRVEGKALSNIELQETIFQLNTLLENILSCYGQNAFSNTLLATGYYVLAVVCNDSPTTQEDAKAYALLAYTFTEKDSDSGDAPIKHANLIHTLIHNDFLEKTAGFSSLPALQTLISELTQPQITKGIHARLQRMRPTT